MKKIIKNENGTFSRIEMTAEENLAEYNKALEVCYRQRESEYPKVADYLDAQAKGDTAAMTLWNEAQLAVKVKYPKPLRSDYGLA